MTVIHSLSYVKSLKMLEVQHLTFLEDRAARLKEALDVASNNIIKLLLTEPQHTCDLIQAIDSSLYFRMHVIMDDIAIKYPKIPLIKQVRQRLGGTLGDAKQIEEYFLAQYGGIE